MSLQFTYNCFDKNILDLDVLCRLFALTFEGRVKECFVTLSFSSVHSFEHFVDLFTLFFGHYDFVRLCNEWKQLTIKKGESLEYCAIRTFNLYCRFPLTDRPMIQEWFHHTSSSSHESDQIVDEKIELYINDESPLGLDLHEESKDLKIVEMTAFSFLDMDHNQYDDSDELNVVMPMSISHEIQS